MGDFKSPLQVLVPIAGRSNFFPIDQYFFPKPLIEVGGKPMIERVIENLRTLSDDVQFIFVVQREDVSRFSLDRTLQLLTDGQSQIVQIQAPTQGALCSALLAIDAIDPSAPLVIANGDQIIDMDLSAVVADFQRTHASAGVVTFESVHPRWSYVKTDGENLVHEAAEKRVISKTAVAGFYYFESGRHFSDAAMKTIINGASVDDEYFIAPSLNEIVLDGHKVSSFRSPAGVYHSFYSPEKIREFEDAALKQTFEVTSRQPPIINVVIPAAGEGSRFRAAGFINPKPFIDVLGRPMVEHVIDNVTPHHGKIHILLRRDHLEAEAENVGALRRRTVQIHEVDRLTEGTACTLLLARASFDTPQPMLVANSDQYVDFSVDEFVTDCLDRNLDGSILVFRAPDRDPKWSYAKVNDAGIVIEVAEKHAISDLATVGIYLFRRGDQFVSAAVDMIANNDRINGEFYTCPVYNYMIRSGLRIGIFEVPAHTMSGLGTPEDLDTFLKRQP